MCCSNAQDWNAETIDSPLIIIGLPRTGTTFLLELLSTDEHSWRTLKNFEAHWMTEPASEKERVQERIATAFGTLYGERTAGSHSEDIDGPTEDASAMMKGLCGTYFRLPIYIGPESDSIGDGPYPLAGDSTTCSFDRMFLEMPERQIADFEFYKDQLRLLQAARRRESRKVSGLRQQEQQPPSRWCLKDPIHLANLSPLLETFPDAKLVFLHRHPVHSVSSGAMLVESINESMNVGIQSTQSRQWATSLMHQYAGMANVAVQFRKENPDFTERVCDIYYDDFVNDPLATADKIYKFAGALLSREARAVMELYLQKSYRDRSSGSRRVPVRRTISDFGIDHASIDREFAPYINLFFGARQAPAPPSDECPVECPVECPED